MEHADRLVADRSRQHRCRRGLAAQRPDRGHHGRTAARGSTPPWSRSSGASPLTIDPRDEPAVAGARAWLNPEHRIRPLEVEAFLVNETPGYGGTCDLIAELDGEAWLLDWKSAKSVADATGKVWAEMRLQLAAYANAEFIARVGDPERHALPRSPGTASSTSPTAGRGSTRPTSPSATGSRSAPA